MVRYCKCGCGQVVNKNWVLGHYLLGRTLEEAWGSKAKEIIKRRSQKLKGKTYEEIYGEKRGKEKRIKQSLRQQGGKLNRKKPSYRKGKIWDEIYGKEKTEKIKKKIKRAKIKNGLYWTKEKIIKSYKKIAPIRKSQFIYYRKKKLLPDTNTVRKHFGSLDKLAVYCNIPFLEPLYKFGRCGQNERKILDYIEQKENIKLKRQYQIYNYFVDGYDKKNNVVYEVDEYGHKYQKIQDEIRDNRIKKLLKCEVIRINEIDFINSLENKKLNNFILK